MKMIKILLTAMLMLTMAQAEKFDPVKYEAQLMAEDAKLQTTIQRNIAECKVRAERAKRYRAYLDANPNLNSKFTKSVVESCQARVTAVCGAIMSAAESNASK